MADNENDVSVEGSAARIADRGRDQMSFGEGDDRPSLGSPDVVADLVGDFCLEVIETRTKYLHDEIDPDGAKINIRLAAKKYGRIILGEDNHYLALTWHSAQRLGERIKKVIPPVKGVTHPGEQLFLTLAGSVTSISVALGEERLTDDEAKAHLLSLQEQANKLILGMFNADAE